MRRFISATLCLCLAACDDLRTYSEYDDLDAIRADGAFEKGWFPAWMPEHAIDIHEYHDLDTSLQAISFRLEGDLEFEWPTPCSLAAKPNAPHLKTNIFPKSVHRRASVQKCDEYYVWQGTDGAIHMWTIR